MIRKSRNAFLNVDVAPVKRDKMDGFGPGSPSLGNEFGTAPIMTHWPDGYVATIDRARCIMKVQSPKITSAGIWRLT